MKKTPNAGRIESLFSRLLFEKRGGLAVFITGGDPDLETSRRLLESLPQAGADLVELGMPFSDPIADGKAIQAASTRALNAGAGLADCLNLVAAFRRRHPDTPLVLMGYANPIHAFGREKFIKRAARAGADGLILIDVPPEEEDWIGTQALKDANLRLIRLVSPVSAPPRIKTILAHAEGFVYYVSITGVTGTRSPEFEDAQKNINLIRRVSSLPIAIGFGITRPSQAARAVQIADMAVAGSVVVETLRRSLDAKNRAQPQTLPAVLACVRKLAKGVRGAKNRKAPS